MVRRIQKGTGNFDKSISGEVSVPLTRQKCDGTIISSSFILFISSMPLAHFSLMVKEANNKIGCCAIKYTTGEGNSVSRLTFAQSLTCNYRETNLLSVPTFSTGEPASRCNDWGVQFQRSEKWENLCAETRL